MVSIQLSKEEFEKFIMLINSIGLQRKPDDTSTFPLDFVVFYKEFVLNFEYATDTLEFYIIGERKNGKEYPFASMDNPTHLDVEKELRQKIIDVVPLGPTPHRIPCISLNPKQFELFLKMMPSLGIVKKADRIHDLPRCDFDAVFQEYIVRFTYLPEHRSDQFGLCIVGRVENGKDYYFTSEEFETKQLDVLKMEENIMEKIIAAVSPLS